MNSRERFEQIFSSLYGTPTRVLKSLRDGNTYKVVDGDRVDVAWKMWQEASQPTVVQLPEAFNFEGGAYCTAHTHGDKNGEYLDRNEVIDMLDKAGVKHNG